MNNPQTLDTVAQEIRALMQDTKKEQAKIGAAIYAVSSYLSRPAFIRWLDEELHISYTTAQRFITVSQHGRARALPNQPAAFPVKNYGKSDPVVDASAYIQVHRKCIQARMIRNLLITRNKERAQVRLETTNE